MILAREHVGVGHARHGNVLVAFPASVPRIGNAHQPGRKLVAQIALQNSLFNQHRLLRGRAFIIHIQRSPTPRHRAVVHHGAFLAGHTLANQPRKCRRFLAVEIGFQSMSHGLMQKHSRPSRTKHDFHLSRRSLTRIQL